MTPKDVQAYWSAVLNQNANAMRAFFKPNAWINWHNSNEHFTVEEFICANCKYPGNWNGKIEKLFFFDDMIITVTHVFSANQSLHLHVTSFIKIENGKIISIDEYWGDDGDAPEWRRKLKIGTTIK